jgi:hypothetical protein
MPGLQHTLATRLLDVEGDSSALADDSPRLAARTGPTGPDAAGAGRLIKRDLGRLPFASC